MSLCIWAIICLCDWFVCWLDVLILMGFLLWWCMLFWVLVFWVDFGIWVVLTTLVLIYTCLGSLLKLWFEKLLGWCNAEFLVFALVLYFDDLIVLLGYLCIYLGFCCLRFRCCCFVVLMPVCLVRLLALWAIVCCLVIAFTWGLARLIQILGVVGGFPADDFDLL